MVDDDERLSIVFNGELYNYRELRAELTAERGITFRSGSDTEVVLEAYRAWGTDCLKRFNGMFSLCICDRAAERLFLARDRAGEKPLFYTHAGGQFRFASELKALLQDRSLSRRIDPRALHFYLAYGYVPGSMCMLDGVHKLPQGHAMTYSLRDDSLQVWPYWKLPSHAASEGATRTDQEYLDEFEGLLEDSVRRQLVADVPVGVLLSGGIDSSLVTAMAARVSSSPVRTFTVSFPGHGSYNEAPYAKRIAEHFGTQHTELVAEPGSLDLLPELARQFDEPMADSSMVPTFLVSRMIRRHATVALGGDGGDELFGGYPHHRWIMQLDRHRRFVPRPLAAVMRHAAERLIPVGMKGRNYLLAGVSGLPESISQMNSIFDAGARASLLHADIAGAGLNGGGPESYKQELSHTFATPLLKATGVDFMTYLVDDILVKVDRASMLASLEVRAPWLDHRLIDFAFGVVPDRLKVNGPQRKILPRRLAERLFPAGWDLDRKQGFSLPLASWFRGEWGTYVEEVLREADPAIFARPAIDRLIADQRRGRVNMHRLFALTIFELWRREYGATL